jgi:hypothetical protein
VVFIGVRGQGRVSIDPPELFLAVPCGQMRKLHVSAGLYEVVLPPTGTEPPSPLGLTSDFYANELRRDEVESQRLEKEGKSPFEINRATSFHFYGIEFSIRRSKFPGQWWLIRLWVSALVGDRPGIVPAHSSVVSSGTRVSALSMKSAGIRSVRSPGRMSKSLSRASAIPLARF